VIINVFPILRTVSGAQINLISSTLREQTMVSYFYPVPYSARGWENTKSRMQIIQLKTPPLNFYNYYEKGGAFLCCISGPFFSIVW
jgi:hypothetical protein